MPRSFLIKKVKGHNNYSPYKSQRQFSDDKVRVEEIQTDDDTAFKVKEISKFEARGADLVSACAITPFTPLPIQPFSTFGYNGRYFHDVISGYDIISNSLHVLREAALKHREYTELQQKLINRSQENITPTKRDDDNDLLVDAYTNEKEQTSIRLIEDDDITLSPSKPQTSESPPSPDSPTKTEYTVDTFSISDGRARRRRSTVQPETGSQKERLRYSCNECGKSYATSSNLSRHKQTHRSLDSQNAKKCPHCKKVYVSMPALSMHILTHDLRHDCTVCGKSFSRPWLLQGHMRSHTGEKPYGCAHCGKAFADRSNLRAHMQTHSPQKSFQCTRCNKTFALKSYLNKHYESACLKE